jgi:acyl carrier protein
MGFEMNEKLITVLAEVFNLRTEQIVPELTREDVGNWDSLKQMDLVMSIERTFGITLEIADIVKMTSVANIMEVLRDKGAELDS